MTFKWHTTIQNIIDPDSKKITLKIIITQKIDFLWQVCIISYLFCKFYDKINLRHASQLTNQPTVLQDVQFAALKVIEILKILTNFKTLKNLNFSHFY